MGTCSFRSFEVTIRGDKLPYAVAAEYRGQTAYGEFAEALSLDHWRVLMQRMENSIYAPDADALISAGSRLFYALFDDEIHDLWIAARSELEQHQVDGVRLRLALLPAPVAALPWECLYDPARNSAFAASGRTPVVRTEKQFRYVGRPRPLIVKLPLKILLAAPEDASGQIDAEQEIAKVRQVLDTIGAGRVQVTTLTGRFSILDLRQQLERDQPDVLHVISHGTQDGVELWQHNRPVLAPGAALRSVLEHTTSVKLVFLNACLAGLASDRVRFRSVAPQLLQAGVPAVVAMQFEIRDDRAIDFAQFLYRELVAGACPGSIDAAVGLARSSLYALNPGDFAYGTPVLWLNADDGIIFNVHTPGAATPTAKPAPDAAERINLESEARWLAQLELGVDLTRLPRGLKSLAFEWERSLRDLHSLITQLRHLHEQDIPAQYTDKAREYREQKAAALRLKRHIQDATQSKPV